MELAVMFFCSYY